MLRDAVSKTLQSFLRLSSEPFSTADSTHTRHVHTDSTHTRHVHTDNARTRHVHTDNTHTHTHTYNNYM